MNINFIIRISSLIISILLFIPNCFSQFENTIGSLAGSDETTDIKPLPNGHTAVLANTTSYGPQKILLIELDAAGHVVLFKTLHDVTNPAIEYTGTSLELDLTPAGLHMGYYITGCRGNYPTQMILFHTDVNGNPTWAWQMDHATGPNSAVYECGVSIELQSNRDIIVIGRSDQMADLRFTASRFTPAGALLWSHRYGSDTGLQYIPNESCNGLRGGTEVVTIVGHIHDAGIGHTFLSCIRASNGQEFWRRRYNSDHFHDDGTDVVHNPVDNRYMLVGHAENLVGPTRMWVINANGNNGLMADGATYSLLPPFNDLFARDICLSPDIISATIAGFVGHAPTFGSPEIRTFIMKLPFAPAAVPVFSHYFTDSDPQLFLLGDDAIESIGGVNPGYVLGTEAKLAGAALPDYDVHALRLNLLGMHNLLDCPVVPFVPEIDPEGQSFKLSRVKSPSTWSNLNIGVEVQNYLEEPCDDIPMPPQMEAIFSTSEEVVEVKVYPNPVQPGSDVHIEFEASVAAEVKIQLMDITGRLCAEWKERLTEGKQIVQFPLPPYSADHLYIVRLVFPGGRSRILRLLVN